MFKKIITLLTILFAFTCQTSSASPEKSLEWTGPEDLFEIVDQASLGSCQSFSFTAFMEFIIYHETGQKIKLSEKHLAYYLLNEMIDEFYNEENNGTYLSFPILPKLSHAEDSIIIDVINKYGLIPSEIYPYRNLSTQINVKLFNQIFENPTTSYSNQEYHYFLDKAFLSPPPTHSDITNFEFSKDRFHIYLNIRTSSETRNSNYHINSIAEAQETGIYYFKRAKDKGIDFSALPSDAILTKIIESLNKHIPVNMAGHEGNIARFSDGGGGGHMMLIVGYQEKEGKIFFKIRNSRGKGYGYNGYYYVDADTLLANLYWITTYE